MQPSRLVRALRRTALGLCGVGLAWIIGAWALDAYGRRRTAHGRWQAIVVAGASVWRGGEPSKALSRRTLAGVELWREGYAPRLVLTGGIGDNGPAEAEVAAELARKNGVPAAALVIENRSHTTEENARFTRLLIGDASVLVVTDAYHVLRSELIYRREFRSSAVVGLPLGKYVPLSTALREVPALLWFFVRSPAFRPAGAE
jgi:uncharacterized SAM-binding protein YcdF (DUF218 family)